jgi:UDPglucose--hexose-1-phosphate uridylyltransferase
MNEMIETKTSLHKRALVKPDGRELFLYSRRPIDARIEAPSPSTRPWGRSSHLRWHPLLGEWVASATHRQDRTFLPPAQENPLAPTLSPDHPTELPAGDYDIAVFTNLFPTFVPDAGAPPESIVPTRPGLGTSEVVVYTQDPKASLGELPLAHVALLVDVWADRTKELGAREEVAYVFPFENRGQEVGVTLHHPHGQIYAYPFVPPVAARELAQQAQHFAEHGSGLLASLLEKELEDGRRMIYEGPHALAFVPAWARFAYEVWIAPRRAAATLVDLNAAEREDLARAFRTIVRKYDGLWSRMFPYVMALHQAPTDGKPHPEAHVHMEFYPPYRTPSKLKFLAGSELGAGVFTADTSPEEKALELRAVPAGLEDA